MEYIDDIIIAIAILLAVAIFGFIALRSFLKTGRLPFGKIKAGAAGATVEIEEAGETPGPNELLEMDKVDEEAYARPMPILANVLDRQLKEVYEAVKEATALISGGIRDQDHFVHVFKRSQVQIVFEIQVQSITNRLIYNGLNKLKPTDTRPYCKDRAARILSAVENDLSERMISLNLPVFDLKETIQEQEPGILEILEGMYRSCIQIAKDAHPVTCEEKS